MTMPRQLHHEGFEDWGHTVAGYMTDYAVFAVCSASFGYMLARIKRPYDAVHKLFLVFLASQGVSFLCGGVAHHMLDLYASRGEVMGRAWSDSNSGWMFPWIYAVALSPISSGTMVAMVFIFSKWPMWMASVSIAVSAIPSCREIAFFISGELDSSGMASAVWAVIASGLSLLVLLVGIRGRPKKEAYWSRDADVGAVPLLAGVSSVCTAWGLIHGVPASCSRVGEAREGCPFPVEFNHNAIFHTLLVSALLLICLGMRLRTLSSSAAIEASAQEQTSQAPEADVEQSPKSWAATALKANSDQDKPTLLGSEGVAFPKSPKRADVSEPSTVGEDEAGPSKLRSL